MSFHTNFLRQAMGPYDPKLIRSIDSQFKKRKWFEYSKNNFPKYKALEKCGEHKEWYNKYFKEEQDSINYIIRTFEKFNSSQIEIVATVYGCWIQCLENKYIVTDELLVQKFYDWDTGKEKYERKKILNAIAWMREKGFTPKR